ncbi:hypothetical protein [Cytobacillus praedii]|uniref:Uncharacterized protein n=1 Tax=Cytobacillus praedii TaxID=1742358 RepID=A0A4R1B607_9BACI|nr:hypothetical protein [Cytobacillus praedii]MED3549358.1 hypothetical protein [Cytobacillus praedii]MED3571303.1 hypothetical protein [Cytobacillus praedii]TCJ06260.1 hypothetical protein E0Y62_00175 [Cytobacillus praedii]
MSPSRILKWLTGALEAILGIPVLGATIVVGLLWIPLAIMLVLHIITLVLTKKDGGASAGSILGIVTSCVAWIPFVGMIMHILSAIFLMIDASKKDQKSAVNEYVA